MADLNISTIELTSTLRTAPLNGAPSSSDYNESQRETLVDLSTISLFINNLLLPLINALPASALQPNLDPTGIEGRTIWTDTSDQGNLFFDSLSSIPLTIADTIRVINGIITTMNQELIDQGIEVASLQARLASTNQNDISLALQNLSSALNQLTVNQQIQAAQLLQIQVAKVTTIRGSVVTVPAGTTVSSSLSFASAYPDNFYTATISLETPGGADGLVSVGGFRKVGVGAGITVSIINNDVIDQNVIVHVIAQHD
jgi:hypothetical protein